MSSRSSITDNSFDVEELLQIETRCRELRKEKDMLRDSQPQSFELIRRLELHVKTLSEARAEDEKRIQELERELNNCSQEIDYLQDQLNARNEENYCLGEHVHSLELKITETGSLEETVGSLSEELNWSNSERLFLMQELESKEVELQNSASCIEKLEESVSSVALEYQCEIESMKFDMTTLERRFFEVKKLQEEDAREKVRMNELIQDLEIQIQNDQEIIGSLEKENKELRFKLETSQRNAEVFCRKIEEEFKEWLEKNDGPPLSNRSLSRDLEENISTCGNILGPLLSRLPVAGATDADLRGKMDKMSSQICQYELLVKQLKEEVKEEKSKARDEAEDLAQEMAELRYQLTGLLEEERKRRACIEQLSLKRIAQLESQAGTDSSHKVFHISYLLTSATETRGSETVRPSENWERLVRATLRREKLRQDGRGGHERAPRGIAGSVPPSLTRETTIDLILQAADAIQSEDPNVARIQESFQSKVCGMRKVELSWFQKAQLLSACNNFILNSIRVLVMVTSFGLFTLLGGDLAPSRAFTSMSLFAVLRLPLNMLPNLITQVVNANVSLQRLEELFLAEERILLPNPPPEPGFPAISIKDGNFSWDSKAEKPTLSNINLDIPVGSLVAVVGGTGEEKMPLISAMIGELPPVDSTVVIRGTVAYVPQISWIFNATVRENILFGSNFETSRYWKTIDVTALQHDLDLLPVKYQYLLILTNVYIFDDPLSALDAHVGRQFQKPTENAEKMEEHVDEKEDDTNRDFKSSKSADSVMQNGLPESGNPKSTRKVIKSVLIKQEERETGVVSWKVLTRYKDALGGFWVVMVLFMCYVFTEVLRVSSSTWLSFWTNHSSSSSGPGFFILIYALSSFGQILTNTKLFRNIFSPVFMVSSLWVKDRNILRSLSLLTLETYPACALFR
ncbi:hypothetical protein RHMOL_Rhmol08G0202400 [Rhododendron molle]|uniref:Uncharacterized protein n=1 Tax=Rhododendron molle TaxID=49168 RepID=A0ACC0MQB3_RHOML|nr:hypothetical protein RHMOL_Rhmol08G0202400 [Rhododendron molle]